MADDELDLEVLLRSPLDDPPQPFPWAAVIVVAVFVVTAVAAAVVMLRDDAPPDDASPTGTTAVAGGAPLTSGAAETTTVRRPLGPPGYPGDRYAAEMARYPEAGVVMFGGSTQTGIPADGTWLWETAEGRWIDSDLTEAPNSRVMHTFDYVDSLEGVVMFGGGAPQQLTTACVVGICRGGFLDDMWLLDLADRTWREMPTDGLPPPRIGMASAYDSGSDTLVMFGGVGPPDGGDLGELFGDTWLFDPEQGAWENLGVLDGPSERVLGQMTYDPATDLIFLWGGRNHTVADPPDGMWAFDVDGRTWREIETKGVEVPDLRWNHRMDHDPETGLIVMLGGEWFEGVDRVFSENVWTFDPVEAEWRRGGALQEAIATAAAIGDGGVIELQTDTRRYDVEAETWEVLAEP